MIIIIITVIIIIIITIIVLFFDYLYFIFLFFYLICSFHRGIPTDACIIISLLKDEVTVKFERFNLSFSS